MKISEAATVDRKRASPCTYSARGFAYACLFLIALVSRDALALDMQVTYAPGEFHKSIVVPRIYTGVTVNTPGYICNWPTTAQLQERIPSSLGALLPRLTQMESFGTETGAAIVQAMNVFMSLPGNTPAARVSLFSSGVLGSNRTSYVPPQGYEHRFADRCLDVATARDLTNVLGSVIRGYLGLPPRPLAPAVSELPASTKPAAIKPAATGLDSPVQIRP